MNLEKIRKEFPVTEELIFFDHARVAPLPERVRKVVTEFVDDATRFGTAHYEAWMAGIEQSRQSFARLINAGTDEVAFVKILLKVFLLLLTDWIGSQATMWLSPTSSSPPMFIPGGT